MSSRNDLNFHQESDNLIWILYKRKYARRLDIREGAPVLFAQAAGRDRRWKIWIGILPACSAALGFPQFIDLPTMTVTLPLRRRVKLLAHIGSRANWKSSG